MNTKRIFIIVASIVVIIGILVAVYFVFFAPKSPTLTVGANPFTTSGNTDNTGTTGTAGNTAAGTEVAPHLVKITNGPVAFGAVALDILRPDATASTTATSTKNAPTIPDVEVRYIDRASGNVYAYTAGARTLTRISNRTLPGVQKAAWVADGSAAFVQFLAKNGGDEHVQTYALPASGDGGYFLEQDLAQVAAAGSGTLFSLLTGTTGSIGTVAKPDGSGARTLFSSALSSIVVGLSNTGFVATTKASAGLDGYAFTVDPKSGGFTRILGPLRGLTTLPSPSGKLLLFSYAAQGALKLAVLDMSTQTATALPLATVSEKCAWAADSSALYCGVPTRLSGTLPDDWFQGATSFSDRIWRIDMAARLAKLIVDPSQVAHTDIDVVAPVLDTKTDLFVFTNKKDGSLWAYDLRP